MLLWSQLLKSGSVRLGQVGRFSGANRRYARANPVFLEWEKYFGVMDAFTDRLTMFEFKY